MRRFAHRCLLQHWSNINCRNETHSWARKKWIREAIAYLTCRKRFGQIQEPTRGIDILSQETPKWGNRPDGEWWIESGSSQKSGLQNSMEIGLILSSNISHRRKIWMPSGVRFLSSWFQRWLPDCEAMSRLRTPGLLQYCSNISRRSSKYDIRTESETFWQLLRSLAPPYQSGNQTIAIEWNIWLLWQSTAYLAHKRRIYQI
jgi:hypothetical protein